MGPKQNLKGPSIEIHYQFSNFGGPLGPQAKFHKGPNGFSGAQGPYHRAPESPVQRMVYDYTAWMDFMNLPRIIVPSH